jgi:hypothetical protein
MNHSYMFGNNKLNCYLTKIMAVIKNRKLYLMENGLI